MSRIKHLFLALICLSFLSFAQAAAVLTDLQGHKIPFDSLRGKWVFINYWASWCNPCLDEIAELNQFYADNKDNVALFAVNYEYLPVREQVKLTAGYGIRYPGLAIDPRSQLRLPVPRGVPATFVFNPQGKLVDTLYGGQTLANLNRAISAG